MSWRFRSRCAWPRPGRRHGWVQSRAARELGLTLRQIGYRIRKYGLARDGEDVEPEGDIQD